MSSQSAVSSTQRPTFIGENEPLARHTSWRVGGAARFYGEALGVEQLQQGLGWACEHGLPWFLLGAGSNLLVRDSGFAGLVLRYRAHSWRIEERGGNQVLLHVEAGAPMAGTARRVAGLGWGGLAWAEGLPGTIGGALYGNAGCYGGNIAATLEWATLLVNGQVQRWDVGQMGYGYRTSVLKAADSGQRAAGSGQRAVVLAAELRLERGDPAELAATMARIAAERRGKTPWGSSCGSVFKNPSGQSAGRLIEQAGLKGTRSGGAMIAEQHANYIVNLGGASSDDLLRLIELARGEVLRQFGVELELEVMVL